MLVSLVGTIGKVLQIKNGFSEGVINPRLMRLRPDVEKAFSDFLEIVISSEFFTSQVLSMAGGGTMPVINKKIVSEIELPIIPKSEQVKITEYFQSFESRGKAELELLRKLKIQKAGLMDDLLTGRVRVTELIDQQQQAS